MLTSVQLTDITTSTYTLSYTNVKFYAIVFV